MLRSFRKTFWLPAHREELCMKISENFKYYDILASDFWTWDSCNVHFLISNANSTACCYILSCLHKFGNVLISHATSWLKLHPKLRTSYYCSNVFSTNLLSALLLHASKWGSVLEGMCGKAGVLAVSFSSLYIQCLRLITVVPFKVSNCSILFSHLTKFLSP